MFIKLENTFVYVVVTRNYILVIGKTYFSINIVPIIKGVANGITARPRVNPITQYYSHSVIIDGSLFIFKNRKKEKKETEKEKITAFKKDNL